jgi:predicted DNA-binding protein (MmcQ/YjbR family)
MTSVGIAGVSSGPVAGVRDKVLEFALSFPETAADHPWGEDVVKVKGKIFVFAGSKGSKRMTVKLEESHAHALSTEGAERTGYGLGDSGWVTVPLRAPGVSLPILRDWIEESYRIVAPKRVLEKLDTPSSR